MYISHSDLVNHYSWTPFGNADSNETRDREAWWGPLKKKDNLIVGNDEAGWNSFNSNGNRKVLHILGHGGPSDPHLYGMSVGKLHGSEVAMELERCASRSALESLQFISVYACYASTPGGVGHAFAENLNAQVKVIGSSVATWKVIDNPDKKRVELWVVGMWPKTKWFYENWHDVIKEGVNDSTPVKSIKVKLD